jgi:hypothetical protein
MKKKKKKQLKKKPKKTQKRIIKKFKDKRRKPLGKKNKPRSFRKKINKKSRHKVKKKSSRKVLKKKSLNKKTRALISSFLKINDKIKSLVSFNFNLDQFLQNFFIGISKNLSGIKKIILEEREKQKLFKIKLMEKEKKDTQRKLIQQEDLAIVAKKTELKHEQKLERERKIDLQKFIRLEQAELRKEQAEKQRKFLEQIRLEKRIEQFRKREALEIKNLEKYVLSQERESYEVVQERIDKIKAKYKLLREQKIQEAIKERVEQLGIKVEDNDNKETLLEKERVYTQERQKIEFALESFYRSAHSLCFQINKRYIPKYLSIMRVLDRRFETGEIFIKWDEEPDENWLILIYIKDNSPEKGIIIEDKTDPDKNISHEFNSNEIFKASDMMVDALTKLLDRERNKRKAN